MKKMKRVLQLGFALLSIVSVVALAKMDTKAAGKITGLAQESAGMDYVSIKWNAYPGTERVKVYSREKGSTGSWTVEERISSYNKPTIDKGMSAGKSYEVRVEAYGDELFKKLLAVSDTIEVVTEPDGSYSFALRQTAATDTTATVSWSAYPGANCYKAEYSVGGTTKVIYVNGTSVKLTGLPKNKYVIVGVNPCRKNPANFVVNASGVYENIGLKVVPSKAKIAYTDIFQKKLTISLSDTTNYYADGYEYDIYKVKGNKRIKLYKPDSSSTYANYTNKAFAKKDLFKVKVRSYAVGEAGEKYYSAWTSWSYFSTDNFIKDLKNSGKKGITVKWNKINGATGYKVYASTKRDKGYKVVATIKKGTTTSATFKKYNKKAIKNNKKYYVYVEPYYKSGKKTYSVVNGFYTYICITYKK